MKKSINQWIASALAFGLLLTFTGTAAVSAQDKKDKKDPEDIKKAFEEGRGEAAEATKILNELMGNAEKRIPRAVLQKAVAIGVFPNIAKGGFIVGGQGGDGVVARRTKNGWSAPVFYDFGGANVGLQAGIKKSDYIMLFMQEGSLKDLLNDKLEFGADASFAAGPIEGGVGANTALTGNEAVLIYSRSDGLFGGATVGGATMTADNSRNTAFYKMNGGQVLQNPTKIKLSTLPAELQTFTKTIETYTK